MKNLFKLCYTTENVDDSIVWIRHLVALCAILKNVNVYVKDME